jgi:hypothetical protein
MSDRKLGKLREWLSEFPDDSELFFECSIYGDEALIIVECPNGEYP